MGETFDTRESLLALCLILAGAEPADPQQPAFNLFDQEILFKIGGGLRDERTGDIIRASRFSGMKLEEAASAAWREGARGDVGHVLKMSDRLPELALAYREQCRLIDDLDMTSGQFILKIYADAAAGLMQPDEMVLRIACVILKTRGEFMNVWKKMVPLLRIPNKGKTTHFETTATGAGGKTVPAKGVQKPGFKVISLNMSPERKKEMGLA
jgi:hypothetical protein